jgi:hypothetical protein
MSMTGNGFSGADTIVLVVCLILILGMSLVPASAHGEIYLLDKVNGIATFNGSTAARELLAKNGFVVADPAFKQIFEPYIKSPMPLDPSGMHDRSSMLPSFITVDSAWHTYHVLLEEGVKELEEAQSERLAKFSRQLHAAAHAGTFPEVASFAAIGLALQDQTARASLSPAEKDIVESLLHSSGNVSVPIGFPLSPLQFRAQSFYTQSPELSAYFAARQWYAGVIFRLANPHETDLALKLATLVNSDTNLLTLWKQLSDPFDMLLSTAEDGTVPIYAAAAKAGPPDQIAQKLQATVPKPFISDQQLSPQEYDKFGETTRGFRLLPPRHLPCSVCFHKSTDPSIANRRAPSGLDFMVASPVLRSAAAIRAAQSQFGKPISDALLKIDAGPLPDSLYGDSMKLLSKLQQPLPTSVAPAFRTDAWGDLQLWTQLAAWAEQRHTWALHAKLAVSYMGIIQPPRGLVAPYPDFFAGLAKLSRDSAAALQKAAFDAPFELKSVAADLVQQMTQPESRSYEEETMSAHAEHISGFLNQYYSKHQAEIERDRSAWDTLKTQLQSMAKRVAQTGQATAEEAATIKDYYDSRVVIAGLLSSFAETCDRLADLATKCRDGRALSQQDTQWIERYGTTLANYHFYYGNSFEVPTDNFPIVTRVYANPLTSSMFYAGLTRPQALYVIVDNQLYRGAVMSYREFVRPDDQLLDDDAWREVVFKGKTPPAPAFTRSFYAERSFSDWLAALKKEGGENYGERQDILWQIGSSATEKDLPELIKLMESSADRDAELAVNLAQMIASMPCHPYQSRFIDLLGSKSTILSDSAALILSQQATNFDPAPLMASLDAQGPRVQRLRLAILGAAPRQTTATAAVLVRALKSPNDGVRWQAAQVIGKAHWSNNAPFNALIESLKDTNAIVAANAVRALVQLNATHAGPSVFAELKLRLAHPPSDEEEQSQQQAVALQNADARGGSGFLMESLSLLDPDNALMRMDSNMRRRGRPTRRFNRMPPLPGHAELMEQLDFDSLDTWMQSLGALQCREAEADLFQWLSSDRKAAAFSALAKLGSPRLIEQMLAKAKDTQADAVDREGALINLGRLRATNAVHAIAPLLDETTPVNYDRMPPGREWRICDRAADTIAGLLAWQQRLRIFAATEERDAFVARVKQALP